MADVRDLSQSSQSSGTLAAEEKEQLIGHIMRFILFKHTKKLPVRHTELAKEVKKRAPARAIIAEAAKRFETIFGYELCEIPAWTKNGVAKKNAGTGIYILINKSQEADDMEVMSQAADKELSQKGLLMTVLALILLNKGEIFETRLFDFLRDLGLQELQGYDIGSASIKHMISKIFVSQMYLVKYKPPPVANQDQEPEFRYTRGPRAEMEISEADLFRWISQEVMEEEVNDLTLKHYQKAQLQRQGDEGPSQ